MEDEMRIFYKVSQDKRDFFKKAVKTSRGPDGLSVVSSDHPRRDDAALGAAFERAGLLAIEWRETAGGGVSRVKDMLIWLKKAGFEIGECPGVFKDGDLCRLCASWRDVHNLQPAWLSKIIDSI